MPGVTVQAPVHQQASLHSLINTTNNVAILDEYGLPQLGQLDAADLADVHAYMCQKMSQKLGSTASISSAASVTSTGSARSVTTQRSVKILVH